MKTQMKFQKWLCFALLILGALAAVLALCYTSGVVAGIGACTKMEANAEGVKEFTTTFTYMNEFYEEITIDFYEAAIYLDISDFNTVLFYLSIVLILLAVVLYITHTNKRRNYYVSNYVASGVVCAANIGISVYLMIQNGVYYSRIMSEIINNPEAMEKYNLIKAENETLALEHSVNTLAFILTFILFAVIIVVSLLLIVNLIWKIKLMKGEKALLEQGFAKEVA